MGNKVTILADACERSEEIDEQRAQEAMESARGRIGSQQSDLQLERAMLSLRRAEVRLNVARRRRARGSPTGLGSGGPGASA